MLWIHGVLILVLFAMPVSARQSAAQAKVLAEANQLDAQVGTLYKQGQVDKAISLSQRELQLREEATGPDDPSVADVVRNLSELYFAKGKAKEGNTAYKRFLQIYEKSYGADSPKVAAGLYRYVSLLSGANQPAESLEIQKRLFRIENGFDFDQLTVQKNRNLVRDGLISGLVTIGETPVYPQEARNSGIEGPVVMKVTIDDKGKLSALNVLSGHPLFTGQAELAARRSTYAAALMNGMPVKVTGILIYNFGATLNNLRNDTISTVHPK